MKATPFTYWKSVLFGAALLISIQASAADYYVDAANGNDANAGTNQATALATIQAGVDACADGDSVWVAAGTYAVSNEIVVSNAIAIVSLNGPDATIVDGGGSNRCFNLGDAACTLSGLTITNGYDSDEGGGIYCSSTTPVVTNCTFSGNSGKYGGGMADGTADQCTFSGNSVSYYGGGMFDGIARHCIFSGNSAAYYGGGMARGTAYHCTFSGNSARSGGGMQGGVVNSCIFTRNSAAEYGGGAFSSTANNCTFTDNSSDSGGGMAFGTANNCTFSGNSARYGGGMNGGTANNCIVWYNRADVSGNDLYDNTAAYTCSPDVTHGDNGCITTLPLLASSSHLSAGSPCIGTGSAQYTSGTDVDGQAWNIPPSMGCDEFSESVSGLIQLGFVDPPEQGVAGVPLPVQLKIDGAASASSLSFGDGQMVSNVLAATHQWQTAGEYDLVLSAYNLDYPDGLSITQRITVISAADATVYVAPDGDDTKDGLSWATAKETIQAGVDACNGGTVLLSNGTYSVTSEVLVVQGIRIQSLNGPESTSVDGGGSTRCFNLGDAACTLSGLTISNGLSGDDGGGIYCTTKNPLVTNCVVRGNSASENGGGMHYGTASHCTFSGNSASENGGGMHFGTASDCTFTENTAGDGGGMYSGIANHCTFTDNSSYNGGGMNGGTVNHCTFTENSAYNGGGMYSGIASHCTFIGNSAAYYGGGMEVGTANHCVFNGNSADYDGGGMNGGTANHCTITGNLAGADGGGMHIGVANNCAFTGNSAGGNGGGMGGQWDQSCTANNCIFSGNWAGGNGGGMSGGYTKVSKANNCTFSGNSAGGDGGGMYSSTAHNCIVWYNTAGYAGDDLYDTTASHTCSPNVTQGENGCITTAPMLVSSSHLAAGSPCIGAGSILYSSGTDIDGEVWKNPPSMGCDEFSEMVFGPIELEFVNLQEQCRVGLEMPFQLNIEGAISSSVLSFGDGQMVSNVLFSATHQWNTTGEYDLVLSAFNGDYPDGLSITQRITVVSEADAEVYVARDGGDANDGLSWATAKASVRAGVEAQTCYGGTVWLADGTYYTSTVKVPSAMIIRSLNGPEETVVYGYGRSFNLGDAASILSGFTLKGGGIYCSSTTPVVTNCTFIGNSAEYGGGMHGGTASHCSFTGNSASDSGGGMYKGIANHCIFTGNSASVGGGIGFGTAHHCTFTENSASYGGGMYRGTANNSIFIGNSAAYYGGGIYWGTANHCTVIENYGGGIRGGTVNNCIIWYNTPTDLDYYPTISYSCSPDAQGDFGSITSEPVFINRAAGNFRLALTSPCIDAGIKAYGIGSTDLDGNARIVNEKVDMGAYEYDGTLYDSDGDAASDYAEYVADTAPMDSNDWFHITSISNSTVYFQSSENRQYTLLQSTNLVDGSWTPTDSGRMGTGGADSMSISNNLSAEYFKVEVAIP
ncbi:choice-of-anchor Q domain-containing protein [Pontiellaceae bacterium B1224]|nr:choice-of-anchor Q domain-containing protein [Pontiellaceae bacterium B1224]